jgi:PST family polysaccharide transporter
LAEIVYLKIDVLMINHFMTRSDAGQYAAATKISEIWFIFPIVIVTTVFPFLWRFRDDPIEWKRRIQMTLDGLAWLGITAAIVISLIGETLVVWLFGAAYSTAATVLVIHIWGGVFIFMRAVLSRWLIAEDLLPLSLLTHLAGAIVNIGLNFWWIPKFGIVGAAWATVVSYAVAGWLALFLSVSTRSMGVAMLKALLLPLRTRDVRYYFGLVRTQRTSQS